MPNVSTDPESSPPVGGAASRVRGLVAVLVMVAGVLAVYVPVPTQPSDNSMLGLDYHQLHARRIHFAQQALAAPNAHLPAWYPRELMGSPFWSNIQNFPFLPTRL